MAVASVLTSMEVAYQGKLGTVSQGVSSDKS